MIRANLKVLIAQKEQAEGKRISYETIARATGVNKNTIARLASGQSQMIRFDTLNALCRYFNVDTNDVLVYIPDESAES